MGTNNKITIIDLEKANIDIRLALAPLLRVEKKASGKLKKILFYVCEALESFDETNTELMAALKKGEKEFLVALEIKISALPSVKEINEMTDLEADWILARTYIEEASNLTQNQYVKVLLEMIVTFCDKKD